MSTWWRIARRDDIGLRSTDVAGFPFSVTNRGWYQLCRLLEAAGISAALPSLRSLVDDNVFVARTLANHWGNTLLKLNLDDWVQIGKWNGQSVVAAGIAPLTDAPKLLYTHELTPLADTPAASWLQAIGQELSTTPSGIVITGEPRKGNSMSDTVVLTKAGEKANLVELAKNAGNTSLTTIRACLGWDARRGTGPDYDLDASIFALDASGKSYGKEWFVYFNNLTSPFGAIVHQGDELTGGKDGDDEQIVINLAALPADIAELRIAVTIYEAAQRGGQNFAQVDNAFVRIVDETTGAELARYDLTEDVPAGTNAFVFAKVYRHAGGWEFKVVAEAHTNELNGLVETYKV